MLLRYHQNERGSCYWHLYNIGTDIEESLVSIYISFILYSHHQYHALDVERSLHLDVRLLTCYREQAKVSSVRTREYIHAGIFPYLKRISDRFISTYRYAFSVHQNISNVH